MTLGLIRRAGDHGGRTAIVSPEGEFTYHQLLGRSAGVAAVLLGGASDLAEERVAFLVPPGFPYVAIQWGIWRAGGVAVPLATSHPPPELAHVLDDTGARRVVADAGFRERLEPLAAERGLELLDPGELLAEPPSTGRRARSPEADGPERETAEAELPPLEGDRRALILYTSGTTKRPKGVVLRHANLEAQIRCLVEAWEWRSEDRIPLVLPLHHVHGIVNVLSCALWSGAVCEILPRFDADEVWRRFEEGELTLFMAVPTIYARLIAAWEAAPEARRRRLSAACGRMRLMVSGSAALPVETMAAWERISGHVLLERYGMTEIGMALSNSLHGRRVPGAVGSPLPGVQVRLVDEEGEQVAEGDPGEILVRGPGVFTEYWRRPEETRAAFDAGWFRTGDVAVVEDGVYRILGRQSVDIIKTGGYKVSALEIEEVLRTHPDIADCAVVGVPDPSWGERVAAAVVLEPGRALTLDTLRDWAEERLAPYKVPSLLLPLDQLPRNALGKVTKPALVRFFPPGEQPASDPAADS